MFHNPDVERDFVNDATKLGVNVMTFEDFQDRAGNMQKLLSKAGDDNEIYLFIDVNYFEPAMYEKMTGSTDIIPVLIVDTFADVKGLAKYPKLQYNKPFAFTVATVFILFFICRNLPFYPFTLLAPPATY